MKPLVRVGIPLLTATILVSLGQRAAPSPVVATVASSCAYDTARGLYIYSYKITNMEQSPNYLDRFGVRPVAHALRVSAPYGWHGFRRWQRDTTAIVWAVIRYGPEPPNWRGQLIVGPYHLAAGSSLGGFRFESEFPPDSTGWFFAQGFDTIPGGAHRSGPRPPANKTLWEEGCWGPALVPHKQLEGVGPEGTRKNGTGLDPLQARKP